MKIRCSGSDLQNFLPVDSLGSLIFPQRNTGMSNSIACHGCSRGGDRVGLEAANLVGVYPE